MNLVASIALRFGGPGSGCRGPNCGRPELYHGTTIANAKKILRSGLKPSKNTLGDTGASATESRQTALNYAYNKAGNQPDEVAVVVFRNHPKSGFERKGARAGSAYWESPDTVHKKYVKRVEVYRSVERFYPNPQRARILK